MSADYQYKPKFGLDMRIRPPKADEEARKQDVHALKEGQVRCDWPGCAIAGATRAPKSRDMPGEHYWFCTPHAGEYNKSWDFYAGMSEGEIAAQQAAERMTGGRPTWAFRASPNSREAASDLRNGKFKNAFGVFGSPDSANAKASDGRKLGKIERRALADMDLDEAADKKTIREKYTQLLKRLHPDSNGGDRSTEDKLQRVIKAYKALKAAKLV